MEALEEKYQDVYKRQGIYVLAAVTMLVMLFVVHLFYNRRKKGVIYIMVVHYESGLAGDEILRSLGKMKYQLKSKTIRGDQTELTMEMCIRDSRCTMCRRCSPFFLS